MYRMSLDHTYIYISLIQYVSNEFRSYFRNCWMILAVYVDNVGSGRLDEKIPHASCVDGEWMRCFRRMCNVWQCGFVICILSQASILAEPIYCSVRFPSRQAAVSPPWRQHPPPKALLIW